MAEWYETVTLQLISFYPREIDAAKQWQSCQVITLNDESLDLITFMKCIYSVILACPCHSYYPIDKNLWINTLLNPNGFIVNR